MSACVFFPKKAARESVSLCACTCVCMYVCVGPGQGRLLTLECHCINEWVESIKRC